MFRSPDVAGLDDPGRKLIDIDNPYPIQSLPTINRRGFEHCTLSFDDKCEDIRLSYSNSHCFRRIPQKCCESSAKLDE